MMPPIIIFYQFIGFLLQTLPISLLGFVPFPDDSLSVPRRRLRTLFGGAMIVLSMGFALMSAVIYDPTGEHYNMMRNVSDFYITACILLSGWAFFRCVRSSSMKKILVFVLLIHYATALFTLCTILYGLFGNPGERVTNPLYIYSPLNISIQILLLGATFPLVYLFLTKEMRFGLSYMENGTLRRGCFYMILSTLLFAVCVLALASFELRYTFSGWAITAFLAAFMLTDAMIYFMFFAEVKLTIQIRQSEEQLRSFDQQYRQITANIAEARRIRHDIRHHLNLIGTMNRSGEQQALDLYLKSYETSFQEWEQISLCGYPAFGSILQYYVECAKEQGIAVTTEFHGLHRSPDFDIIDITVMVGNLMENAIEACEKLPSGASSFIRIWVKQTDMVFLLKVENSCEPDTLAAAQGDFTDGLEFFSTKHAVGHGQGLKSIRLVAEKYGGSGEFKKTNGVFTARVVMNTP